MRNVGDVLRIFHSKVYCSVYLPVQDVEHQHLYQGLMPSSQAHDGSRMKAKCVCFRLYAWVHTVNQSLHLSTFACC